MRKNILLSIIIFLLSFGFTYSQKKTVNDIYSEAQEFLNKGDVENAYKLHKEIYPTLSEKDTLKNYVTWYYLSTSTELEKENRMNQKFDKALSYAKECLKLIEDNKKYFDEDFAKREPWMIKNVIVNYFGLNDLKKAQEYKSKLYQMNKDGVLSEVIDSYFNYDYFKLDDKNIWGYEWYAELPENRFSSSFTKVVYYVYSTNKDGSDKEQLYRFHVLMFHHDPKNAEFDYILERQIETENSTISGSYYQYRYKKDIDYLKLRKDIVEIITKKIEPSSRRVISK